MKTISATLDVKLKPFQVPNFVGIERKPGLKQEGMQELPTIAIEDLSKAALNALAQAWLDELYRKANKMKVQ